MGDTKLQSDPNKDTPGIVVGLDLRSPKLRVSEVFYSLQGEGGRAGEASIFVRLQGCSAKHACYKQGVVCDTEFESGREIDLEDDLQLEMTAAIMRALRGKNITTLNPGELWIVWTGGEPLDQLTPEIVEEFKILGYKQALETSGIKRLEPELAKYLDYIVVSPKVAEHVLLKNFELPDNKKSGLTAHINELRYVRHAGQPGVPEPVLRADHYYLSPHSDGNEINQENLKHCIKLCLENPKWKLSVQQHKLWKVL